MSCEGWGVRCGSVGYGATGGIVIFVEINRIVG